MLFPAGYPLLRVQSVNLIGKRVKILSEVEKKRTSYFSNRQRLNPRPFFREGFISFLKHKSEALKNWGLSLNRPLACNHPHLRWVRIKNLFQKVYEED